MPAPPFSQTGYLPPYTGNWPAIGPAGVAPYHVTVHELCGQFGWSQARREILVGLFELRAALRRQGLLNGFQWIDGSFCEQIERIDGRDPRDVDVATFCVLPAPLKTAAAFNAWASSNANLLDPAQSKADFRVDHYLVDLGVNAASAVQQACYWHSVFSHRRNNAWKGYLLIQPENQSSDDAAKASISSIGGSP